MGHFPCVQKVFGGSKGSVRTSTTPKTSIWRLARQPYAATATGTRSLVKFIKLSRLGFEPQSHDTLVHKTRHIF